MPATKSPTARCRAAASPRGAQASIRAHRLRVRREIIVKLPQHRLRGRHFPSDGRMLIDPLHQEPAQLRDGCGHRRGKVHQRRLQRPHIVNPARRGVRDPGAGLAPDVLNHARDHAPAHLADQRCAANVAIGGADGRNRAPGHRHLLQLLDRDVAGTETVVDVVVVVGDVVGDRRDLALQRAIGAEPQILNLREFTDGMRQALFRIAPNRPASSICQRAVVLDDALQRLPSEVQPPERGIAVLQMRHDAQALGIMVEAANRLHRLVQRILAGMAERRMAEVVSQRNRLDQILVKRQRPRQRPRDLRHLQAVRQPRAVMVALVIDEHLRLMDEPAERGRMHDAVAVALIDGARGAWRLLMEPAAALPGVHGVACKHGHARSPWARAS